MKKWRVTKRRLLALLLTLAMLIGLMPVAAFANNGDDDETGDTELVIELMEVGAPANSEYFVPGETISYEITITNVSEVKMSDVQVAAILVDEPVAELESLSPQETVTVTFDYTVNELDAVSGYVSSIAAVLCVGDDGLKRLEVSNQFISPAGLDSDDSDSEDTNYNLVVGDGQMVTQGEAATFVSSGSPETFSEVRVDYLLLGESDYTATDEDGVTSVTLSPDYTESLSEGNHTIAIVHKNAAAGGSFYVEAAQAEEPVTNPSTNPTTDKRSVVMTIGSPFLSVNDTITTMDAVPFISQNRTMVPLRALVEAFGAEVTWYDSTRTITINYQGTVVVMQIGSTSYSVNGVSKTLDAAPYIVAASSRTVVPVRFVAEALGFTVTPSYHENGTTASVLFEN